AQQGKLALNAGWKVGDPEEYQWRVRNVFTEHMIKFLPAPGFIGRRLAASELSSLGLKDRSFALKVTQLNYGTYLAGIRMGDIVLRAADRSEFPATRDFYAWCEQLRRAGRDIKMELLRQDAVMNVMVSLSYLNYSRVEKAPRVNLGFIVQELPADEGLRVGHVSDDSGAEKTGLRIGDRIESVEGREVKTREALDGILSGKSPGDLLTLQVRRDEVSLQFGFVLTGEEELKSDLARLSATVSGAGQELTCTVTVNLPPCEHIYSMHRRGFGSPTQMEFRGRGFELVGDVEEPPPRKVEEEGLELEPMWILEGRVELKQRIRVTDPAQFLLVLRVYAQVC
ncbi:MAG TPA: PDZ domain-containing protein, partial [Verrucomicrobiae bacterium]|nr:PDZ domain-containing protein [Verrucomicrobiae bacterium]